MPVNMPVRDSLVAYLRMLDGHLMGKGLSTPLYLSGGAAVVLVYGSTNQTKDIDVFVQGQNTVLEELQSWAGKNTPIAKTEGYYFEVVPPIYPVAPGMFDRAVPIRALGLKAIELFA